MSACVRLSIIVAFLFVTGLDRALENRSFSVTGQNFRVLFRARARELEAPGGLREAPPSPSHPHHSSPFRGHHSRIWRATVRLVFNIQEKITVNFYTQCVLRSAHV